MVEQARRVKAVAPSTKVLVYRNGLFALQWLSSERAAMEDPSKADWFLRYPDGRVYYTQVPVPTAVVVDVLDGVWRCASITHRHSMLVDAIDVQNDGDRRCALEVRFGGCWCV